MVAILALLTTPALKAQPDINIVSAKPDLETEYHKELDKWMLQAYEGDRDAQFRVGVLFTNEQFKSPDHEQAVYWYKQAARQGHTLAQYNLGHQYLVGVRRSEKSAMNWWLKAAEQGHALAQFNVGRGYYLGIGLEKDHSQSRLWFERAANNNEPKSIDILEQLGWAEPGQYTRKVELTSEDEAIITGPNIIDTQSNNTSAPSEPSNVALEPLIETPLTGESIAADNSIGNAKSRPIAIYTDPEIRSVLIALVDKRSALKVVSQDDEWTVVTSDNGFPVWVHSRFIVVADDIGTLTGSEVNARSVPIITKGTIVGQLEKGETLAVLDKRDTWFRVKSPSRFQAWVKTSEYQGELESSPTYAQHSTSDDNDLSNDNEWLFRQPADNYTLQLASFDDSEKIQEFVSSERFAGNPELHRFTARSNSIEWTYFLYGSFQGSIEANRVKGEIKQKRAWVRRFGKLQQNRCVAWKKQIPTPASLNKYCVQ